MPKVIILFDSITGYNEELSQMVAEGVQSVQDVEVQCYKIGTKFSINVLKEADALIVGSPSIYGNMTPGLLNFFATVRDLIEAKKIKLQGVKGAVFGSYEWDGGWHVERIEQTLTDLGINIVASALSVVRPSASARNHRDDLEQCRELGRIVANELVNQ